jgi:hypothetical protein
MKNELPNCSGPECPKCGSDSAEDTYDECGSCVICYSCNTTFHSWCGTERITIQELKLTRSVCLLLRKILINKLGNYTLDEINLLEMICELEEHYEMDNWKTN